MTDLLFDDRQDKWATRTFRNLEYAELRVDIFKYLSNLYDMHHFTRERRIQLITSDILELIANKEKKMGRAIDMENDIYKLKTRIDTMEAALEKVIHVMDNKEKKTQEVKIDKQRTSKVSKASSKKTV